MKKVKLLATLYIAILLVGCSNKNDSNRAEVTTKNETKNTTESQTYTTNGKTNHTEVYIGADRVADITMRFKQAGSRRDLCTVEIPTNDYIATLSLDENGVSKTTLENNGKLFSQVIAERIKTKRIALHHIAILFHSNFIVFPIFQVNSKTIQVSLLSLLRIRSSHVA